MIFDITETRYDFGEAGNAEQLMQQHYESLGYKVLNNNFAVVYTPASKKTTHPDAQNIIAELFEVLLAEGREVLQPVRGIDEGKALLRRKGHFALDSRVSGPVACQARDRVERRR